MSLGWSARSVDQCGGKTRLLQLQFAAENLALAVPMDQQIAVAFGRLLRFGGAAVHGKGIVLQACAGGELDPSIGKIAFA